ncbi:hypothetical protein [uncultured Methanobrevibacter sp.]|uniref:hypothetical protein n=1 Tax=uncultured Methanobrevibacter sp. TaxID=253161 RepID=UPI002607E69F
MCDEKLSLEKLIDEETKKIEEKYDEAEDLLELSPSWEVHYSTEIDYETVKLMDLRRKKINQIKELKREISNLNYEIGYKIGVEEGEITGSYKIAEALLKEDFSINQISDITNLTKEQIKQIVQII